MTTYLCGQYLPGEGDRGPGIQAAGCAGLDLLSAPGWVKAFEFMSKSSLTVDRLSTDAFLLAL